MTGAAKITLIGDTGRMGSMLRARMEVAGLPTTGADRPLNPEKLAGACCGASLVLLCVPIAAMPEVLAALVPHMDGSQILADIASVKIQPLKEMQAAYNGPIIGTHPLFGPENPGEAHVAVCPGTNARQEDIGLLERILTRIGCLPFRCTADEHDEAVAYIQGLNFVTSAAYFAALAERPDFLPFLTPSFMRRKDVARTMLTQDAPLFESLFDANPAAQDAVRRYRAFLNLAAGGDLSLLISRAAWWWKDQQF